METSSSSASTFKSPDVLKLGAFELAALIRSQDVTAEDVVRAHITKIKEVDPRLNAIVEDRFDDAILEAREADRRIRKGGEKIPPLLGVPITVKEMLALKGFKSTGGNIHRRDRVSDFDATIVARMKDAGAIVLGTTNVPELGFWFETENVLYGRTNNPYDASRTSGGSSGGEGALVGAGASPLGLGSDIGGSIRMPAAFCGVFGHKPTNRAIPITGHFPYVKGDLAKLGGPDYPYTSVGLLARRAGDLRPAMQLLMGPDGEDPETLQNFILSAPLADPAKFRVFVCPAPQIHLCRPVDDEIQQATKNAARLFEQLGATVTEFPARKFVNAVELWAAALESTKGGQSFASAVSPHADLPVLRELAKIALGRGDYSIPALLTALVEGFAQKRPKNQDLLDRLERLSAELDDMLGEDGILLIPCHPRVAPKHRATWFSPFDFIMTGIFNALGQPATAAPMGLNKDGLPLSVQIVAARRRDHLNFSAAEILESSFGGWQPPA